MENYKVSVPEGKSGVWEVKKFTVSENDARFDMFRSMGRGGRYTPPGTYTSLTRNSQVIMSDTPNEISDHREIIRNSKGDVLINGLGLGMVVQAVLDKPEVTSVTVIEKSQDVISLVGNYYLEKYPQKLTIINTDAFEFTPPKGKKYGAVWHDIWDNICIDNLPQMIKLHRKYGRHANWQGSWCRERLEYLRSRNRWR